MPVMPKDRFEQATGRRIFLTEESGHLPIALDGNAFGDEVFLEHVAQ